MKKLYSYGSISIFQYQQESDSDIMTLYYDINIKNVQNVKRD
jgi:hypothetical protein